MNPCKIQTIDEFIQQLNCDPVDFNKTMQLIDYYYNFTPKNFTNGKVMNQKNSNNGSCKILSFGLLNGLPKQATLHAFGDFYANDVLKNPENSDHQNIRNFMQFGWEGVHFETVALTLKR